MNELNNGDIPREKVNLETSKIAWKDLQRFFAAGLAVCVASPLDLVDVACQFAIDNRTQVAQWLLNLGLFGDNYPVRFNDNYLDMGHYRANASWTIANSV